MEPEIQTVVTPPSPVAALVSAQISPSNPTVAEAPNGPFSR